MSNHTTHQHYTPKYRFRYFMDDKKLYYEFFKNGKCFGHKGVGESIAVQDNLYEPRDNGYDTYGDNAIETNLFANNIERRHKRLIDSIIDIVDSRNVINYERCIDRTALLPQHMLDYNDLCSLLDIQLLRQPFSIQNMIDMPLSKFDFFKWLDTTLDKRYCFISILYVIDDSEFILPDCGMICGTDRETSLSTEIMPITPKICIKHTPFISDKYTKWMCFTGDTRGSVLLEPIDIEFVRWANQQSINQCNEKFVSVSKTYVT